MKTTLTLLITLLFTITTMASGWQAGAGVYYADISGINAYEASSNNNEQVTDNLTVPSFFISKSFNNKFNVIFRYSIYDEMISDGVSSDTNIFNEPNVSALQTISYYRIKEKMYESSISLNYAFVNNDKWKFEMGPSVSITKSNANFYVNSTSMFSAIDENDQLSILRKFSETEYTIGAEAQVEFKLTKHTNLNLNYRYTNPSEKTIHLFGASISYSF